MKAQLKHKKEDHRYIFTCDLPFYKIKGEKILLKKLKIKLNGNFMKLVAEGFLPSFEIVLLGLGPPVGAAVHTVPFPHQNRGTSVGQNPLKELHFRSRRHKFAVRS